jgi:hypothetical protein
MQFVKVKMWQQFNGYFQLLNITSSARLEHLAENNCGIKNQKIGKNMKRQKCQLGIFHLDHVSISTKFLS